MCFLLALANNWLHLPVANSFLFNVPVYIFLTNGKVDTSKITGFREQAQPDWMASG